MLKGTKLLHLRLGEVEVWHGVTFPFRDADWGTPEPVVHAMRHDDRGDAFRLEIEGAFPTTPPMTLRLDVEGEADGTLRVAGTAVPQGDIATNRLGICLLHPMSLAGVAIEVEHEDGRFSRSTFPTLIPPWPPFMLVRAIRHEYAPGRWASCRFDGDVFEFEDQRNNADASFKTYSRSNMAPRPYLLRAGVPVRQALELRLGTTVRRAARPGPRPVRIAIGEDGGAWPDIGIEVTRDDARPDPALLAALAAASPALLHLALADPAADPDWSGIRALLDAAGARLRLDVEAGDPTAVPARLREMADAMRVAGVEPAAVAVFPSIQPCLDAARACFPGARIGGGTPHFFVQLNRLEGMGEPDFVTFTTCPIVHGTDDELVMAGLRSLPSTIETLRGRGWRGPVHVGPSSIAARRSPLGAQPPTDGTRRLALARQDPRCRGLYGAAWMLGHVAALAEAGAEAVTVMSLTGPSGIVAPGAVGLASHATQALLRCLRGPARRRAVTCCDAGRVAAVALQRGGGTELLVANLTGAGLDVTLGGWPAASRLALLEAATSPVFGPTREFAGTDLLLPPYAVARLTSG